MIHTFSIILHVVHMASTHSCLLNRHCCLSTFGKSQRNRTRKDFNGFLMLVPG